MKIGYLVERDSAPLQSAPYDGRSIHVQQVIQALTALGHEVCLLVCEHGQVWQSVDLTHFEPVTIHWLEHGILGVIIRSLKTLWGKLALPELALLENLRFLLLCRCWLATCDVFYERVSWLGYGGMMAAKWLAKPFVLEVNGDALAEAQQMGVLPRGWQHRWECWFMQKLFAQATHIVTAGEGWRQSVLYRWRIDPAKVTTIDNGSQLVTLLQRESLQAFRDTAGASEVNVVYLGGFYAWHGVPCLLKAYAQAIERGAQLHLFLIGNGPGLADSQALVRALGIETHCTFTGVLPTEQYAAYLAKAAIGVSPYCGRKEYTGLKLFDYLAAGLAIIASGEQGQPALLTHGHTAWIVPPCKEEALTQALLLLGSDGALRQSLGRAARLQAEQHHSWQHTAQDLEQLFSRLFSFEYGRADFSRSTGQND